MGLFKLIAIIGFFWFINQVRRFVATIQIKKRPESSSENRNSKRGMDIQDAEYEDVE